MMIKDNDKFCWNLGTTVIKIPVIHPSIPLSDKIGRTFSVLLGTVARLQSDNIATKWLDIWA